MEASGYVPERIVFIDIRRLNSFMHWKARSCKQGFRVTVTQETEKKSTWNKQQDLNSSLSGCKHYEHFPFIHNIILKFLLHKQKKFL